MTGKKLCVFNTPADVRDFLLSRESLESEWALLSTHASVNDFLDSRGIECLQLSSLLRDDFVTRLHFEADAAVENMLRELDKALSPPLSEILDIRMDNIFHSLFRYDLKNDFIGCRCFVKALQEAAKKFSSEEALLYVSGNFPYTASLNPFQRVKEREGIFKTVTLKDAPSANEMSPSALLAAIRLTAEKLALHPAGALRMIKEMIARKFPVKLQKGRKTVSLLGSPYDLPYLKSALKDVNFIHWPYDSSPKLPPGIDGGLSAEQETKIKTLLSGFKADELFGKERQMERELCEAAAKALEKNPRYYFDPLMNLKKTDKAFGADCCFWGNSPAIGPKCLLNEYFLRKGAPVFAAQHGGNYAVQNLHFVHFTTDFSRCNYYFSYGFDKDDLREAYPDRKFKCEIIPAGSYREHEKRKKELSSPGRKKEKVDVLFPPANSFSIFQECRHNSARLAGVQREITDVLDSLEGMKVYVKPQGGSNPSNFALCEKLKTLKRAKISCLKLSDFYDKYDVSILVTEFPSSPLYESLGRDTEIFLMLDPIYPFFPKPFELLKKRVHIFNSAAELRALLNSYSAGTLPKLRNDEYYKKYMLPDGVPAEKVLSAVSRIISG